VARPTAAAPGVAGRPLPDEGSSGSRVGSRRLPPPQLPPIDEGFVPHGRQIVTPNLGLYWRLLVFIIGLVTLLVLCVDLLLD